MQYQFTVCGVATSVKVLKVREMPRVGVTTCIVNGDYDKPTFGGPGWNISCGLAKLGCRVLPVLTYTDCHFGPVLRRWLEENKIPDYGIKAPPDGYSGAAIMIQDEHKEHMTLGCQYGMSGPGIPQFIQQYENRLFENSEMIVLSAPRPENSEALLEAILASKKPFAFSMRHDPYTFPAHRLWRILCSAAIVFANEEETGYILSQYGLKDVEELFTKGRMELFIATAGKRGSRVYKRRAGGGVRVYQIPITDTPAGNVDTVGAGDAYVAGFLCGLSRGCPVDVCAQYGSTMSSFVIEKEGSTTNLPTWTQLLERNDRRPDAVKAPAGIIKEEES